VLALCLLAIGLIGVGNGPEWSYTAHAAATTMKHGHIVPTGHPHDAPIRSVANAANNNGSTLLRYYGGPTMRTTSTTYAIFWEPPTLQDGTATYVSPTYNSLIEQYFNDVGGSGLYNINTQYYDTSGHILNNSTLGGVWIDTSPYPASGCTDTYTPHGCLSDSQLKAEVVNALNVNGWSGGLNNAFFLFTSWGEGSCHGDCAFSNFCAYHNYITYNGQPVMYANMPYTGTDLPNCGTNTSPNNDFDADSTINYLSHEDMEIVTDPLLNAWHDLNGNENGDRCGARFGAVTLDGGLANEEWNGHYYIVQEEYSNAIANCANYRAVAGSLYVGADDAKLYALDANAGTLSWSQPTGNTIISSPTVVKGVVYVGSTDGSVYAFNANTNQLLWSYATKGAIYSSPTVVKNTVYIGSSDNSLYALNATTGILLWSYATGGAVNSSPTVVNGMVYIGSNDAKLYALNASKGTLKWSYTTGGAITSTPTVNKTSVYIGSADTNLYSINIKTGLPNWHFATKGAITNSSPTVAFGAVYIGSTDGSIYALNATTGVLSWSYATGGQVISSPTAMNGIVYIGSEDDYLYALNAANGTLAWRFQTGDPIVSSPRVVDGIVYTGSNDGNLYALWFDDATIIWSYAIQSPVESSPAIVLSSY